MLPHNIAIQGLLGFSLSDFKVTVPSILGRFANQRINEYFRVPSNVRDLSFQLFLIIALNENMNN